MTARPLLSVTGVPVTDPRRTEAGSTVAGEGVLMLTEHEHQVMLDAFLAGDEQRLIRTAQLHRQHLLAGALLGT